MAARFSVAVALHLGIVGAVNTLATGWGRYFAALCCSYPAPWKSVLPASLSGSFELALQL
jgi:hypothetical protein